MAVGTGAGEGGAGGTFVFDGNTCLLAAGGAGGLYATGP